LRGIQFDYKTPYSMSGNFTLQYALKPSLSVQAGYVTTSNCLARTVFFIGAALALKKHHHA